MQAFFCKVWTSRVAFTLAVYNARAAIRRAHNLLASLRGTGFPSYLQPGPLGIEGVEIPCLTVG